MPIVFVKFVKTGFCVEFTIATNINSLLEYLSLFDEESQIPIVIRHLGMLSFIPSVV